MEYNYGGRPIPYLPECLDFKAGKAYRNDRPGLGVTADLKQLKLVSSVDQPGRANIYRLMAEWERSRGNDLLYATYWLRVMRLAGAAPPAESDRAGPPRVIASPSSERRLRTLLFLSAVRRGIPSVSAASPSDISAKNRSFTSSAPRGSTLAKRSSASSRSIRSSGGASPPMRLSRFVQPVRAAARPLTKRSP
jgi:hypothetical protein